MLSEIKTHEINTPGKVLRIIYLLPSLSMKSIEIPEPRAFTNAKGIFKRISIDDSLIKQDEKEILEDLIVAAINDAKEKGEAAAQEEMKNLTGGLPLPPGMKLPF